ncbi:MAG: lyase family protein [Paracoccaceae bacterium]|nr:lyase family protein [Paracoccaceae bacterium]
MTRPIFGDPTIEACFSDKSIAVAMLRFEAALAHVQSELGLVPADCAERIEAVCDTLQIDSAVLARGVATAGVPVPALVEALRDALDGEAADWVHFGATSQDVVDTGLSLCFRDALDEIGRRLSHLIDALSRHAEDHRDTLMLARTRGQLATPITLELRMAQWARPLIACENAGAGMQEQALQVQFGGASGSQSAVAGHGPAIAEGLADHLALSNATPWHTDRAGLRHLGAWLADVTQALAKIGADVALSSRGEIAELTAGAAGGSSTMPHKSNPVTSEALQAVGLKAQGVLAGLNASAVHAEERDGVTWPLEWALLPELFTLTGAALHHGEVLISDMAVNADTMRARIDTTPEVMAEAAVFALAPTIGRRAAVEAVKNAIAADSSLKEALTAAGHTTVDWDRVLDPATAIQPAADVARQIFAERKR